LTVRPFMFWSNKRLASERLYVDVKLFPRGVELIEVQAKVGLPNAPLVDFQLKFAGPGPHAGAPIAG